MMKVPDAVHGEKRSPTDASFAPSSKVGRSWTMQTRQKLNRRGLVLMFSRLLFGAKGLMANSDYLVGAQLITVSAIATA